LKQVHFPSEAVQVFLFFESNFFSFGYLLTPLHGPTKEENLIDDFCWSIATIVKKKFVREKVALPWTSRFCDWVGRLLRGGRPLKLHQFYFILFNVKAWLG